MYKPWSRCGTTESKGELACRLRMNVSHWLVHVVFGTKTDRNIWDWDNVFLMRLDITEHKKSMDKLYLSVLEAFDYLSAKINE